MIGREAKEEAALVSFQLCEETVFLKCCSGATIFCTWKLSGTRGE